MIYLQRYETIIFQNYSQREHKSYFGSSHEPSGFSRSGKYAGRRVSFSDRYEEANCEENNKKEEKSEKSEES